jgi:hypothetical protein
MCESDFAHRLMIFVPTRRATSKIAKGQGGNFERLLSMVEQHLSSKGKMDVDNAVGSGKHAKGVSSAKNGGEVGQVLFPSTGRGCALCPMKSSPTQTPPV